MTGKMAPLLAIANMLEAAAQVFRAADSVSFNVERATDLANKGDDLMHEAKAALCELRKDGVRTAGGGRWLNLREDERHA